MRRIKPALWLISALLIAACSDEPAVPDPDSQVQPDSGQQDRGVAQPDQAQPQPDQAQPQPDQAQPQPDQAPPQPDAISPSCMPMDAQGSGPCALVLGVIWNGKQCVYISGCSCQGKDCGKIYKTTKACQQAHAHCPPGPPPKCSAWDAKGKGACEMLLGHSWDGKQCKSLSGCSCLGADCPRLYKSTAACQAGQKICKPPTP